MNCVKIIGGLGNQMFQYAFGLSLMKNGKSTCYDISDFVNRNIHNGFELTYVFKINEEFFLIPEKRRTVNKILKNMIRTLGGRYKSYFIQPDAYRFYPEVYSMNDIYFDGYWQNLDYLSNVSNELEEHFVFKNMEKINEENKSILSEIQNTESVGIHIRGGDYIRHFKSSFVHGVVDKKYYNEAITKILKAIDKPNFIVFTNDEQYAKSILNNFEGKVKIKLVSHNFGKDSWIDMFLMSNCKHLIITNSSFSWWSAYLNKNNGLVFMPSRWTRFHSTEKINLRKSENWKIIQ